MTPNLVKIVPPFHGDGKGIPPQPSNSLISCNRPMLGMPLIIIPASDFSIHVKEYGIDKRTGGGGGGSRVWGWGRELPRKIRPKMSQEGRSVTKLLENAGVAADIIGLTFGNC